jgi:hypothetical protein
LSDSITLDDELASPYFAEHGKARALVFASYLTSLVDDRSTGTLATSAPKVYERVVGFASSVKAAAYWFFGEPDASAPDFVALAERYLADRALNRDDPDEARRIESRGWCLDQSCRKRVGTARADVFTRYRSTSAFSSNCSSGSTREISRFTSVRFRIRKRPGPTRSGSFQRQLPKTCSSS